MSQSTQSGSLTYNSQPAKNPNTEFFKITARDSGIKLISTDEPNTLTQEQALVVRDIEKLVDTNPEENATKFIRGFKVLVKKDKYLHKALLPTVLKTDEVEIPQESLFRIFLKVTHLQNDVIGIVLDDLISAVSEENSDIPRLRLLLSQLQYLPHIKEPQSLTTKLLDILDIAPFPIQLEILEVIPEILPDSEYNETAEELMKMLDKNDELAGGIIDCLNALSLSPDIRAQVQDHILSKMLTGTSPKLFPLFFDFLMGDCSPKNLQPTLVKIRTSLNSLMSQDNDKENETAKVVAFSRLRKSAVSKVVSENWLSLIMGIKNPNDHKPVDLVVLFMLHANTKLKKRTIETSFRKKVKDGNFKAILLEQTWEKFLPQQLQRDYFTSIVEIASSLLRTSDDPLVTDFASTLFKILFCHANTERTYKQEILENMVLIVGASDQKNVTSILNILLELQEDIAKSPNHATILMRLLEKLDTFEPNDVRLLFEILCGLTCHDEALLGFKEELHMIMRKHLTSAKRSCKTRGIICAVVMAKHIAMATEDQSDVSFSEDSIVSISQLRGPAKEAAAILELTNTSASSCPEFTGLYYDQLGTMLVKCENLDKTFLLWLSENVTNDFQTMYVTESVTGDINDLQFEIQYNLNSIQEMETELAVNIAELTLKPEKGSILVLAPHFRLLRLLHFKQRNGDLSSIDALLGCGVVLPKFEQRDSLGIEQIKQMTDCVFHCINWFRETVSGFVTQKTLRKKVVQRVQHLHELENLLKECHEGVPSHKLPQSYFDDSTQSVSPVKEPIKAPRKKRKTAKSKEVVDDTTAIATTSSKPRKVEPMNVTFREIDTDIIKLLKYPLETEPSNDQIVLNLNQFNYILKDYVTKLTMITRKRDLGLSHLNIVSPLEMMTDCEKILKNLNIHFEVILKKLETEEDEQIQTSFGLILESLSLIFGWSGFQHPKRLDLLRDILKALRPSDAVTLNSVNHLSNELVERLSGYTKFCSGLSQGVNLIKILEALYTLSPNPSTRSKIAKTAGQLLNQKWDNHNAANIETLIKSYMSSASIKSICGMVGSLQDETPNLKSKSDTLEMLKSITKTNFYIFYRNLWESLQERVKSEIQNLTNSRHLTLWRTTALTMQGLMTVVKIQETKSNLVCFLKKSIAILRIFLSHGIPILEIELRSEPDRVVEILKTIQSNTRFLHHLCCYSKLTKDSSLMAYVPQFRLTLETLVYRVKAALVANGCSEAFWMGNLKNRDLQGEDILTQSTDNSVGDEQEQEDQEMPSEEEMDEVSNCESEVFD